MHESLDAPVHQASSGVGGEVGGSSGDRKDLFGDFGDGGRGHEWGRGATPAPWHRDSGKLKQEFSQSQLCST